jgi:hypothetical protein
MFDQRLEKKIFHVWIGGSFGGTWCMMAFNNPRFGKQRLPTRANKSVRAALSSWTLSLSLLMFEAAGFPASLAWRRRLSRGGGPINP